MVANVKKELLTADPLFHLTGGFHVTSVTVSPGSPIRTGGTTLLNPLRYGAMTFEDHARSRLSVFPREECRAIVAYLDYRRATDSHATSTPAIDAVLHSFWLNRAQHAPLKADLEAHLRLQSELFASLRTSLPPHS